MGTNVTQPSADPAGKRQALKAALAGGPLVVAPGVFDLISARLADAQDPAALYMTGYGTVASHLGVPDAGLATYTDMVGRVRQLAQHTRAPLIADGDTGYGGLLNVQHTVRGYEQAGAAAIQLEDQEFPKKCGHTPGRRVVAAEEMVKKIRVAVDSRDDPDFLIIARTDARTTHGLEEALRRIALYGEAGADMLFLEAPESEREMERIGGEADKPLVANMVEGGRTPVLSAERLRAFGYRMAIYPATGFLAAAAMLERVYADLVATGSSAGLDHQLYSFDAFSRLMGFEEVWAFDRRHADEPDNVAAAGSERTKDQED
ncbi:carboxyvinyl-carboxyphosphonate phosphorylmutase [Rhodovibrio sodomensis]|uniref:Carboxyvinyl-carboxyphosphonate phosphorylmutase n=1 Tax=Rhodovibrio sodomensis TaxID=1088 RepID=A0ABS1DAH2_9PROT|nr:carboxyvinyl-carboxyphosphonate phosphorylmutase [Rhodovibrio sodomensis]